MDKEIYVDGIGGLGNTLFQIVAAIHYAETYGYNIILNDDSHNLHLGTSISININRLLIENNKHISYKDTIFKNSKLIYKKLDKPIDTIIHNDYECNKIAPTINNKIMKISGYNQNYNLFLNIKDKLLSYFNLNDINIENKLLSKYNINKNDKNIMIGIRMFDDFKHMTKISKTSYKNALHKIISNDESNYNLIILSDVKNGWQEKLDMSFIKGRVIFIDDDDISQIYIGMICNHIILSESTYHYWIAMFKYCMDPNTKIIAFNDTDMTNRQLALPNWLHVDY